MLRLDRLQTDRLPRARPAAALFASLLAACSGSGPEGLAPGASPPAELRLVFPPPGAWVEAAELSLEVWVEDQAGVREVRVQGILATELLSTAAGGLYQARVPLAPGPNALVVEVQDRRGELERRLVPHALERRDPLLVASTSLAEALQPGEHYLLDARLAALVRLGADGAREILARPGDLLGPGPVAPAGLCLDPASGTLYLADPGLHALVEIELGSGLRSIVSGAGVGSGPALLTPTRVLLDAARARLVALDAFAPTVLLAARLADGERSLLSGPSQAGPPLERASDLALDPPRERVLVLDREARALLAVALEDGARTLLSGAGRGAGPALVDPARLAVDSLRGKAFVADPGLEALVEIELASGDRRLVPLEGESPRSFEAGLVARADGALLLAERDALWVVDPASGARSAHFLERRGAGPPLEGPEELVLDLAHAPPLGRALVSDRAGRRLVAVELASGARAPLLEPAAQSLFALASEPEQGLALAAPLPAGRAPQELVLLAGASAAPEPLLAVGGSWPSLVLALATDGERVLLAYPGALRSLSLSTLLLADVSGPGLGAGPLPSLLAAVALEPGGLRAFAIDAALARVIAIELATGERTVLADLLTGSGPLLADPRALEVDGERLLVLDRARPALVALELASGMRTILSDSGFGGAPFDLPRDLARDPRDGLVFTVHDAPLSALIATSPWSGERALVAR